eukprot:c29402_g2_i1 orf=160-669(-)
MGKIPVFYGNAGEDVEVYLRDFKRACIANGDRAQANWLELLPSFLEGKALTWYEEQERAVRETWASLSQALIEDFQPEEKYEDLLHEATSLSQGGLEKVKDYGSRVQKLVARFRRHVRKEGGEQEASIMVGIEGLILKHFVSGMRPEIRQMVRYERAATFARALSIALR